MTVVDLYLCVSYMPRMIFQEPVIVILCFVSFINSLAFLFWAAENNDVLCSVGTRGSFPGGRAAGA